ncbi:MAG: 2-amino-4-hydroxy-6-hydroxymethyldihydropteridine diphosphokinase [Syntrophomonadaceae bacterium]|nr:2-amino-4-hydroxy-6-hydroxymethyldihydropteridine diphosphokinase [Syntrophomonadaceae bacterium]
MCKIVYVGLGTNLGNKRENLSISIMEIEKISELKLTAVSSVYESPPWGNEKQDDFFNQVVAVKTALEPLALLDKIKKIEIKMGRQSGEKWGPRVIDLDILLYGEEVICSEQLTIPHQHMRDRLFVLVPLREIAPDLLFPDDGASIEEVLNRVSLRGRNEIKKL